MPSANDAVSSNDASAAAAPPGLTRKRMLAGALIAFTALVACLAWLLAAPFLPALVWGLSLAIVAAPLHEFIERRTGKRPALAAGLSVAIIAIGIMAPVALVARAAVTQGVKTAASIQKRVKDDQWRKSIEKQPRLHQAVSWVESQDIDFGGQIQGAAGTAGRLAGVALASSAKAAAGLLLTLFILFFFFRDRAEFLGYARGLMPLTDAETDSLFGRVADTIHATIYGTVLVRVIQGALGGLMFWWLGLPAPLLWGAVMTIASLVPVLGAFVVWVPAAIFLAVSGSFGKALILTVWGAGVIGTVDNLLYPVLVGDRLKMHTLPVFISTVGGLAVFGAAGLVLGPLILALGDALVDLWRTRTRKG